MPHSKPRYSFHQAFTRFESDPEKNHSFRIVKINDKSGRLREGDVIEFIRMDVDGYSLQLANGSDGTKHAMRYNDGIHYEVGLLHQANDVFTSVQDIINAYPAVSKHIFPLCAFEINGYGVGKREKLCIKGVQYHPSMGDVLEVESNMQEITIPLPGYVKYNFMQAILKKNELFQKEYKNGFDANTILNRADGTPRRVRFYRDDNSEKRITDKLLKRIGIDESWFREDLIIKSITKYTLIHDNDEIVIADADSMGIQVEVVTEKQDKYSFKDTLENVSLNMSDAFGCEVTVLVDRPIDTPLRPRQEIVSRSKLIIHKAIETEKVLLQNENGYYFLVKKSYGGFFVLCEKRYETARDLASAWRNEGSNPDAEYRICKTDLCANDSGLSNCVEGDKIRILEITTAPVANKHISVLKCIRESDGRTNNACYSLEACGRFERIRNLQERDIKPITEVEKLSNIDTVKLYKPDPSLSYDPLMKCQSLRVIDTVKEVSVIANLAKYNGEMKHSDPFELPVRRHDICVNYDAANQSDRMVHTLGVKYLPVVDRITKKAAKTLCDKVAEESEPSHHHNRERRPSQIPDLYSPIHSKRRTSHPCLPTFEPAEYFIGGQDRPPPTPMRSPKHSNGTPYGSPRHDYLPFVPAPHPRSSSYTRTTPNVYSFNDGSPPAVPPRDVGITEIRDHSEKKTIPNVRECDEDIPRGNKGGVKKRPLAYASFQQMHSFFCPYNTTEEAKALAARIENEPAIHPTPHVIYKAAFDRRLVKINVQNPNYESLIGDMIYMSN